MQNNNLFHLVYIMQIIQNFANQLTNFIVNFFSLKRKNTKFNICIRFK